MVRMDRRGGTWKLLGSVVYAHRQVCERRRPGRDECRRSLIQFLCFRSSLGINNNAVHRILRAYLRLVRRLLDGEGCE